MQKTLYICDICKKDYDQGKLRHFVSSGHDICIGCQGMIIAKVIKDKLINLTPWCKICKGAGRIKECTGYDCDRNQYEWIACKECKL